jgi:hypothetical protein
MEFARVDWLRSRCARCLGNLLRELISPGGSGRFSGQTIFLGDHAMKVIGCLLAGVALVFGFGGMARSCDVPPPSMETNLANHKPLAAVIAKADKVVVYEGLPHQLWEKELLADEKKTKKTIELHDFPFYAAPIAPKDADRQQLTAVLGDATSLTQFVGEKRCGGFHPDWCIEWHAGDNVVRCLVCFGCREVKLHGHAGPLHADLSQAAAEKLATTLEVYKTQRPQHPSRQHVAIRPE